MVFYKRKTGSYRTRKVMSNKFKRYGTGARVHRALLTHTQKPLQAPRYKIYTYRQFAYSATVTQGTTAALFGLSFIATQLPQWTTFASLYDMYRINYLEFTFRPIYTPAALNNASSVTEPYESPVIYTCIDKNDAANPLSVDAVREYQTCDEHNDRTTFTRRFKPGVNSGVSNGSVVAAGASVLSPWLNTVANNIVHYGLKLAVPAYATNTEFQKWNIDLWISVSFKNVN